MLQVIYDELLMQHQQLVEFIDQVLAGNSDFSGQLDDLLVYFDPLVPAFGHLVAKLLFVPPLLDQELNVIPGLLVVLLSFQGRLE